MDLLGILDRVVTFATVARDDSGGRVQVNGVKVGGKTETREGVAQFSLPYFYSVAMTGVRGLLLRLLRGGVMVAAKHIRPTDAVAGEAGIFSPGGALMRLLPTDIFELKGTAVVGGISLGSADPATPDLGPAPPGPQPTVGVPGTRYAVVRTGDQVILGGTPIGNVLGSTTRMVAS